MVPVISRKKTFQTFRGRLGPQKVLMWAFPYHPFARTVFMASQIPGLPKIMERHTLQQDTGIYYM